MEASCVRAMCGTLLPVDDSDRQDSPYVVNPHLVGAIRGAEGSGMAKVLVIDDEPAIVRFLVRALDASGHVVLAAHDGAEGLRLAAERRPDLVILDLVMPGLSGMAVLA